MAGQHMVARQPPGLCHSFMNLRLNMTESKDALVELKSNEELRSLSYDLVIMMSS